jgi:hypothetical protein
MSELDALDKLIVDEGENPDINLLAELIMGKIMLTKSGGIIFEKEFYNLRDPQKILIYLLGRKAINLKRLTESFEEKITSKELSIELGIPYGSVSKYFSVDLKSIVKAKEGKYFVPNYNLFKCKEKMK